ncbi:hypothetical protein FA048_08070 [Pedobacter polaris]|uniref:DUF3828 domain-containing protein n=1 Tax=Pedobacter polaris TaxID=2571273 RepID=A0A4U1CVD6_9SPHI|nr:hypothetical protein [Pedobacter polaris]TKC10149.1 hypothetical protein FA048_08070 [Pedobacter polaris]
MMKQIFFYLSMLLFFSSCNVNNKTSAENEINSKIDSLFKDYDFTSTAIYSTDLRNLLNEAIGMAKADAERILRSDHPTDKPRTMEDLTFTGVLDGTKQKVKKIAITGNTAEAIVEIEASEAESEGKIYPAVIWETKVQLINENGWKIDNIIYTDKPTYKNQIKYFISETKKEFTEK